MAVTAIGSSGTFIAAALAQLRYVIELYTFDNPDINTADLTSRCANLYCGGSYCHNSLKKFVWASQYAMAAGRAEFVIAAKSPSAQRPSVTFNGSCKPTIKTISQPSARSREQHGQYAAAETDRACRDRKRARCPVDLQSTIE